MTSKEAIEKIKNLLFGQQTFGLMKTKDGVEMRIEGDVELEKEIYIITPNGELPAPEGEFEMEDGLKLIVKEGKVGKIDYPTEVEVETEDEVMTEHEEETDMEEEVEVKVEEGETEMAEATLIDGTIVETDGDLVAGAELYVKTEEGRQPAPDGEHETVDGDIVMVQDGKIVEIKVKESVEEEMNMDELLEVFTAGFNHLSNELEVIKEKYETMRGEFQKFSAEPAAERQYINKEYVDKLKEQRFSKLEALAALRNKKINN